MTLSLAVSKHSLVPLADYQVFLSSGQPLWLMHVCSRIDTSPFTCKIGAIALSALAYDPLEGLVAPREELIEDSLKTLGYKWNDEYSLATLESRISRSHAFVNLTAPETLSLKTGALEKVLTLAPTLFINIQLITLLPEPQIIKSTSYASMSTLMHTLKYPKQALSLHQAEFFHGLPKAVITASVIQQIALHFQKNQMTVFKWLKSPGVCLHSKLSDKIHCLFHKSDKDVVLYGIFKTQCWKGGYKQVYMGVKITDVIRPYGITFADDAQDIATEKAFRSHPVIGRLLTKFDFVEPCGHYHVIPHTWANMGSLYDTLKHALTLDHKKSLVLGLLSKMSAFHAAGALHLDLNTKNLLVNYDDAGTLDLWINDVGTSILKTETEKAKTVITQSAFLAPELIKALAGAHGYYWSEPVFHDFTVEQRELSERFQVGLMVYEIFFRERLAHKLIDHAAFNERFPLNGLTFNQSLAKPELFSLDRFIDGDELMDLNCRFRDFFDVYYKTLPYVEGMPYFPQTGEDAPLDNEDEVSDSKAYRDALYDAIYEAHFKDPVSRHAMLKCLDEEYLDEVMHLYKTAFQSMNSFCSSYLIEQYAKAFASLEKPLEELVVDLATRDDGIMAPFLPLLSLDPTARPPLEVILAAYKAKLGIA